MLDSAEMEAPTYETFRFAHTLSSDEQRLMFSFADDELKFSWEE